jgi:hypothetical protein
MRKKAKPKMMFKIVNGMGPESLTDPFILTKGK